MVKKRPRPLRRRGGRQQPAAAQGAATPDTAAPGKDVAMSATTAMATATAMPATMMSFAEASEATGIDKYRLGDVVRRAGVPVYKSPQDARKKFIKREDVGLLTAYRRVEPAPAENTAAE